MIQTASEPWSAVERAAREAYGQLVAQLAYRWRDIAAAEDALGDALIAALKHWPARGVPDDPRAWLMTAAMNKLRQVARHRDVVARPGMLAAIQDLGVAELADPFVDHRLRLLFVCAHPAIDESARAPLMLQTVFGVSAKRIAPAFLVTPSTLSQRLVRAKQKILDAGIAFAPPGPDAWSERIGAVLEGIYAAFDPLPVDAMQLAELFARLVPDDPEVLALDALLAFSHARRDARVGEDGAFVPLEKQNTARWDRSAIVAAEKTLARAASFRRPGPYQLEAAIQSAHCQRLFSGVTPWRGIVALYDALDQIAPTIGTMVAHAVAEGEVGRGQDGLQRLASLDPARVEEFQPFWVARAYLLELTGDLTGARIARARALGLTTDPKLRAYLATD